jgi:hypothetical protein
VVSWKRRRGDERLGRERRLGDAEEQRLGDRGLAAALDDLLVLLLEDVLLDLLVDEEVRVADVLDADAPEHLPNDDLDVLVVDGDALQAVDLLDLVDEVAASSFSPFTRRMSCGLAGRPSAARRRARDRPAAPGCACPWGSGTRAPDR